MLKAVIFDLDNTIIDSVESIWRCSDHVLRKKGYRGIDRETAERAMGLTIFDLFALVEPVLNNEQKMELFHEYKACYMGFINYSRVLPNAREAVEYAKWRGLKVALVTTKSGDNAKKILKSFGLFEYFELIVGFEDTAEHKPSPEPIKKAAYLLGVSADEILVVGDTDMDVKAGKGAGTITLAVTTGVTPLERIQSERPDYIIKNLLEIKAIIKGLLSDAKGAGYEKNPLKKD